jgi:hypothetical protein
MHQNQAKNAPKPSAGDGIEAIQTAIGKQRRRLAILTNSADLPSLAGALINSAKHVMPRACVLAR